MLQNETHLQVQESRPKAQFFTSITISRSCHALKSGNPKDETKRTPYSWVFTLTPSLPPLLSKNTKKLKLHSNIKYLSKKTNILQQIPNMVKSFEDIVTIGLYYVVSEHIPLQEEHKVSTITLKKITQSLKCYFEILEIYKCLYLFGKNAMCMYYKFTLTIIYMYQYPNFIYFCKAYVPLPILGLEKT
jgi:hypothetical protein